MGSLSTFHVARMHEELCDPGLRHLRQRQSVVKATANVQGEKFGGYEFDAMHPLDGILHEEAVAAIRQESSQRLCVRSVV